MDVEDCKSEVPIDLAFGGMMRGQKGREKQRNEKME